jgi:hypothetical protein
LAGPNVYIDVTDGDVRESSDRLAGVVHVSSR